jgi:thioredoxin reductase (NADPH)
LTAALYAARANLNPLIISGNEFGGQIALTNEVENYPGFPDGITGPELTELMKQQSEKFGARFEVDHISSVDLGTHPFVLESENQARYQANSLIIATGASPRRLGVPGEMELTGRGVSYCATCDGFFFRGKDVAVVGGGDSALQEGLFLTRFASKVNIVHRRHELRAQQISESELPVQGVFVYIGHYPNTELFRGQLDMDAEGYLTVDERLHTRIPGVFAAGEAHDHIFKQAIVSAGYGCMAAMEAEKFLAMLEHQGYDKLVASVTY